SQGRQKISSITLVKSGERSRGAATEKTVTAPIAIKRSQPSSNSVPPTSNIRLSVVAAVFGIRLPDFAFTRRLRAADMRHPLNHYLLRLSRNFHLKPTLDSHKERSV